MFKAIGVPEILLTLVVIGITVLIIGLVVGIILAISRKKEESSSANIPELKYCRNCGKELVGSPELCTNCGAKPLAGNSYCPFCDSPTNPLAEVCVKCGASIRDLATTNVSNKSRLAVSLLAYFLGGFGIHRFYLGKIGTGLLMLFTFGGFGIWTLIDFIMAIAGLMRDKDDKLIVNW